MYLFKLKVSLSSMQYLPLDQVNASKDDSNFKGIKLTIK